MANVSACMWLTVYLKFRMTLAKRSEENVPNGTIMYITLYHMTLQFPSAPQRFTTSLF